ncbi:MAG: succinylglutamate desuccinylase/aspartoacylase family protein [Candidatus Aenigmarchaeota archaeon]|nr:succinylglutamate desuccinylase/aspartoacylase family protein [Candidatus Aenigmarchaeota archaeon]
MKKYLNRLSEFRILAKKRGLKFRIIGTVRYARTYPLFRIDWKPAKWKKKILFAGVVHGDEPAGAWGIKKYLQGSQLPRDKWLTFFPVVNPSGYEGYKRRNDQNFDLNRNWLAKKKAEEIKAIKKSLKGERFSVFVSIHDNDWRENEDFYLYYYGNKTLPVQIVTEMKRMKVEIDKRKGIGGVPAKGGLVYGSADGSFEDWMYRKKKAKIYIVPEMPSKVAFRKEVEAAKSIIEVVVNS